MSRSETSRWDLETRLVAGLAGCLSILAFLAYLQRGEILLYGDAVAHVNIARRVFDSRTPGLLQLGTVWLPLPHLLMIPFLLFGRAWQTGVGGSIPSLAGYVLSVVGIFRLVRSTLSLGSVPNLRQRVASWIAAVLFAANPNLLYLQATALTEPVYLACFIWAAVFFGEFAQATEPERWRRLSNCGLCLAAACLARYDGWFLAVATGGIAVVIAGKEAGVARLFVHRGLRHFILITSAAPVLWLAYNAIVYRNPLEFANGPYSAKAIENRTAKLGAPPHPGAGNIAVAASFFVKAGELNLVQSNWHRLWLVLALAGTATVVLFDRRLWALLLLWAPLPFYTLSIAYGGVPIFLPPWWPHSFYNVRYGIELLPAFSVFLALAGFWGMEFFRAGKSGIAIPAAVMALAGLSYAFAWKEQPISFREGWVNSRTRVPLEKSLARQLQALPQNSTILMYLGDHGGALQDAGIPLRRVIQEGNHRTWKQPTDPEGLWERALADPAKYADFVVAMDRDPVDTGANKQELTKLVILHVEGQPEATLYRTRKP